MWLPLSLAAAVFWGVGQVLVKKGFAHITPLVNSIISGIFALLIFVPLGLIWGVDFHAIIPNLPIVIIIVGTYISFFYALEKGQVSLTGTVIAAYPLITILLARIFLLERTSTFQKYAILLVFIGIILISLPKKAGNQIEIFKKQKWLHWALAAAIVIGIGDFLAKITVDRSDASTYIFMHGLANAVANSFLFLIDKKGRVLPPLKINLLLPTLLGLLFMQLGLLAFDYALSLGKVTLVSTVANTYVAISVVLAVLFLKDKLTQLQTSGIVSVIIGVILISL